MHIENSDIQEQLMRILGSPAFKSSELLSKFLSYIVQQSLEGNKHKIKAYNIAVDAFGREPNFDPQSDSIVRITASKLRKELNHYYNGIGVNDKVFIEIPKGKYIPEFKVKGENNSKVLKPFNNKRNKKSINIYRLITAFLLLVIITLLVIKFSSQPIEPKNEKPAIILFEFQNLTNDSTNNDWISGFTEELAVMCSRHAEIDIIGPIDKNKQLHNIEDITNTNNLYAVEGSVSAMDKKLKVNVRLLDYKTNKIIWAKKIQKELGPESLIDAEYEIVNSISNKISSIYGVVQNEVLKKSNASTPDKLSSHLSVLKLFQYLRHINYDDYILVKKELQKVTIEDPNYALGWSALATITLDGYMYFNEDSVESFSKAQMCLSRALEIDPENVFVQSHRVFYSYLNRDLVNFYDASEKVENLNPSNIMIGEVGVFMVLIGDSEKGLKLIKEAQEMSVSYPGYFHLGAFMHYYREGNFEQALIETEMANMPDFFIEPLFRSVALINLNKMEDAKKAKKELLELIPGFSDDGAQILSRILYLEQDINSIMKDFNIVE